MFKKLLKNKKAQQTAEYALLIALVVAAVVAMQTYAQRAIQARIRDASQYLATQTNALGTTNQYEPYYATRSYDVARSSNEEIAHAINLVSQTSNETQTRVGNESTSYSGFGLINGL